MITHPVRHTYPSKFHPSQALRSYPVDSAQAKARLVVLALLADGELDKHELERLEARGVYASLGLSREEFVGVLFDFCSDAAHLPDRQGSFHLTPAVMDRLLAEIDRPEARKAMMRLIFNVISSDGKLAEGEERLFWSAVDAWHLRISDLTRPTVVDAASRPPPEYFYG